MAGVAEGLARVASDIAADRRARGKLATEIKAAANERRSDVESFLKNTNSARGEAARQQAAEAEQTTLRRQTEIKARLDDFAGERDARQRERREQVAAQRKEAAAFKRDLTNGVDAFRDKLSRHGRDRAAEIRSSLCAYAQDRADGTAIWRGAL